MSVDISAGSGKARTSPDSTILSFFDQWIVAESVEQLKLRKDAALRAFLGSATHRMLEDDETKLWWESPNSVFEMFKTELTTGDLKRSRLIAGAA